MASEWQGLPLGDVVTLQRGFDLSSQNRRSGNVPVVSSSGISGYHDEARAKAPGVVTGRYGTIGQVFLVRQDFWPLNTTLFVKDFKGNDEVFISYLLRTLDFLSHNDKSSVPGVNRNHLHMIPVVIPVDPREQKAIARHLSTLDEKIELNEKMNRTLETMAHALFRSWFVDFDPVRAKAEGRDSGLIPEVAQLFPDTFEELPTGPMPSGWTIEPVGNLTEVSGGTTPNTKEPAFWTLETHAWATPRDLSKLTTPVLSRTERRISDKGLAQIGSGLQPEGTVLLSSRAPIGYLAIAEVPVAINQGFIAMRAKEGVSNLFLWLWAASSLELIKSRANGSTFLEISKSNFRVIEVVRPSPDVMAAFDRLVRPLYQRIVSIERESAELVALRDSLLPKLISGELKLSPTESEA